MNAIQKKVRTGETPHGNFSFTVIGNEIWEECNVNHSLFNGTVFSDCKFYHVVFDGSDFEGTRFIHCEFHECSLDSADFRSIWSVNCIYEKIKFDNMAITDASFHQCHFFKCSFLGMVQSKSDYDTCLLDPFLPEGGSIILNRYSNTVFKNSRFKNIFYYHIFDKCHFENTRFEAYLLGYIFGLTQENLCELQSVFVGNDTIHPLTELLNSVEEIYTQRKMYLNIEIMKLNSPNVNAENILIGCTALFKEIAI